MAINHMIALSFLCFSLVLRTAQTTDVAYNEIMAIEQPKFKVLKKDDDIELREYSGYILSTVSTSADSYATAGNKAFSPLAGYIFGDNTSRKQMPMTAPVFTSQESEKISMTAPVMTQHIDATSYRVSFVMPSSYKMKDLPIPNNSDVQLQEISTHKSVAIRFSGYTTEENVAEKVKKLKLWAKKHNITLTGQPMLARYDAPWKPGFLRHNEILIQCE